MSESPNPSLLSEYYPTSSSSLQQHTYLRVLWLPLSMCFLWSGETLTPKNTSAPLAVTSPASGGGSFSNLNHSGCTTENASNVRRSYSDPHAKAYGEKDEKVAGN